MGQCCALPYAVDASCTVCSVCESAESDGRRVAYRVQCCSVLCAVPTQLCSFAEMGIGSHVRPAQQSQRGGVWYCSSMPCCVVCRMQCLSRRGKCRACEVWVPCAVLVVCSAVQYVGTTDPTVLPIRKMPVVLVYDPLDNHEIAFGVVHFALRRFPRWCARRWGRYCPPMHGRVGGTLSHPRSARAVSLGVSLRIHSHLCGLWSRAEYRPSPYPRTSAASAQPRLSQRLRPRG